MTLYIHIIVPSQPLAGEHPGVRQAGQPRLGRQIPGHVECRLHRMYYAKCEESVKFKWIILLLRNYLHKPACHLSAAADPARAASDWAGGAGGGRGLGRHGQVRELHVLQTPGLHSPRQLRPQGRLRHGDHRCHGTAQVTGVFM